MTIQTIADQPDEDRAFAREQGQAKAAIDATMNKAKLLGLYSGKREVSGPGGGPIQSADLTNLLNDQLSRTSSVRLRAPSVMMKLIRAEKARRQAEAERQRVARDAERIRARCQGLVGFIREAWAVLEATQPFVHGWHIGAICDHLEAITLGALLAQGLSNRLLIIIPPGTMKSLIVSVFWPALEWDPKGLSSHRFVTTSYSEAYVKRDSRRMRSLVTSEWYRSLWPEVELIRSGQASFANSKTGFREGMPFKSLTGSRGDRVIIDDPHSIDTAESEAEREATTRTFRESVPSLHAGRQSGMIGYQPVPVVEVMAYCALVGISDAMERMLLLRLMQAMDRELLTVLAKKAERQRMRGK